MGTSPFAVPTLKLLAASDDIEILLVVSQPDRPSGRGMRLTPTPVSAAALELGLPLETPERLRLIADRVISLNADALVVVSYGQILSTKVLNSARHGGINLHASLLPRWRGAAPIHRALASGDSHTGVASMRMERTLDTGAILLESILEIRPYHDAETLEDELATLGAPLMLQTLRFLRDGSIDERVQTHEDACYAHMLTREDGFIDFSASTSDQVDRQVRAYAKRPGTSVIIGDKSVKVHAGYPTPDTSSSPSGTITGTCKDGLIIATTSTDYVITIVQPPGKPAMPALAFANGARLDYPLLAIKPTAVAT
jgi:methionyl-tRNA formyltransferase